MTRKLPGLPVIPVRIDQKPKRRLKVKPQKKNDDGDAYEPMEI